MFGGLMKFLGGSKQMHDIAGGDTMSGIGQQYGQSQEQLMNMNPQITSPHEIFAGNQMQVGSTPGIMGRFGYGEGQWAPGKGIGMAGAGLYNMFQQMGQGGGQGGGQGQGGPPPPVGGPQTQQPGFMQRMMKGSGGKEGLMSQAGVDAMTGHLNQPQEDFTQYMSEVQTPTNTWGEQSNNSNTWY